MTRDEATALVAKLACVAAMVAALALAAGAPAGRLAEEVSVGVNQLCAGSVTEILLMWLP